MGAGKILGSVHGVDGTPIFLARVDVGLCSARDRGDDACDP